MAEPSEKLQARVRALAEKQMARTKKDIGSSEAKQDKKRTQAEWEPIYQERWEEYQERYPGVNTVTLKRRIRDDVNLERADDVYLHLPNAGVEFDRALDLMQSVERAALRDVNRVLHARKLSHQEKMERVRALLAPINPDVTYSQLPRSTLASENREQAARLAERITKVNHVYNSFLKILDANAEPVNIVSAIKAWAKKEPAVKEALAAKPAATVAMPVPAPLPETVGVPTIVEVPAPADIAPADGIDLARGEDVSEVPAPARLSSQESSTTSTSTPGRRARPTKAALKELPKGWEIRKLGTKKSSKWGLFIDNQKDEEFGDHQRQVDAFSAAKEAAQRRLGMRLDSIMVPKTPPALAGLEAEPVADDPADLERADTILTGEGRAERFVRVEGTSLYRLVSEGGVSSTVASQRLIEDRTLRSLESGQPARALERQLRANLAGGCEGTTAFLEPYLENGKISEGQRKKGVKPETKFRPD